MITTMPKLTYFWHSPCGHGAGPYDYYDMAARDERNHKCDRLPATEAKPCTCPTGGGIEDMCSSCSEADKEVPDGR